MCAATLPKIKDVTDFRFKKLRDLQISDSQKFENAYTSDKLAELLAVSNKYGILFVGTPTGVQAIFTSDIENVNEDERKSRIVAEEYRHKDVVAASQISHISLSCDDNVLAVCSVRNGFVFADMYDVPTLTKNTQASNSFTEVKLSSDSSTKLIDFKWNPETVNMFATCLSDRSVSIYEISEGTLKIVGSLSNAANASTICWSPKGKQLVIGKHDGSMTQHLPSLQVAKTIAAPSIYEGVVVVVNIVWLSSYQFAVMYNAEGAPRVMIVNSPKSGPPSFINFDDICYSTNDQRPLYYYMAFLPEWNVLICSSSSSIDIAVLAVSKVDPGQTWEQWTMDEGGRAELPLKGSEEMFPLGLAVNLTSQHHIQISETETVSPKPILHVLVSGGLLCSYYIFNDQPDAKSLVRIPENIPESKFKTTIRASAAAAVAPTNVLKENNFSARSGINLPKPAADDRPTAPSLFTVTPQPNANWPSSAYTPVATKSALVGNIPNVMPSAAPEINPGLMAPKVAAKIVPTNEVKTISAKSDMSTKPPLISNTMKAINSASSPSFVPTIKTAPREQPPQLSSHTKVDGSDKKISKTVSNLLGHKTPGQTALMAALVEEVSKFNAEVAQVRERVSKSVAKIGSEEDRKYLITQTRNLESFVKVAKETAKSLNVDIHTLNGCIFDTFATIEEGRLLNERSKDPRYLSLHKSRPLDPIRIKKMREIRSLYYYLQNQLQEVNMLLDSQWEDYQALEKKSITSVLHRPNVQLVYQTLATNRRVINNLQQKIHQLAEEADKYRSQLISSETGRSVDMGNKQSLMLNSPYKSSVKRTVSINELANISSSMRNIDLRRSEHGPHEVPKTILPTQFKSLRNALEKRQVAKVSISSVDEEFSRFISPTAKLRNRFKAEQTQEDTEESEITPEISVKLEKFQSISKTSAELPKFSSSSGLSAFISSNLAEPVTSQAYPGNNFTFGSTSAFAKSGNYTVDPSSKQESTVKPKVITSSFFPFQSTASGDSKLPLQPKSYDVVFSGSNGATSTPSKTGIELVVSANGAQGNMGILQDSSISPLYEDITPPGSPSNLLLQSGDLSRESAEEEEYDDEEEYEDENDVDEYDVEEAGLFTEREGSEGENDRIFVSEELQLSSQEESSNELKANSENVVEDRTLPVTTQVSALNLKTSPVISPSTTEIRNAPPVIVSTASSAFTFGYTATPNATSVSSPVSFAGMPILSSAAQIPTTKAVTGAVSASTFSFTQSLAAATTTEGSPTTTTHTFVMPTFGAVTTTAPATPSYFGRFASTTSPTTETPTSTVSIFGTPQLNKPIFEGTQSPASPPTTSAPSFFGTPGKSAFAGIQQSQSFSFVTNSNEAAKTVTTVGFGQSVFQASQPNSNITPFGQPTTPTSSGGSLFGQGGTGFFSGLGGKPSPSNASKNIFGGSSFETTTGNTNLFGNKSPPSPGTTIAFGTFSGGGAFSGGSASVCQTGFGGFQQSSIKPGGFGGSPQFGSAPTFGSPPAATFGAIGSHVFGSRSPPNASFTSFAAPSDTPTFGSLASQTSPPPSFNSLMQQPTTPFASTSPPTFGSIATAGSPPPFNSTPSFGSGQAFSNQNSNTFSQWRS